MKKLQFIIIIIFSFNSLSSWTGSLFEDPRARYEEDIFTVLIMESSVASQRSNTDTDRDDSYYFDTGLTSSGDGILGSLDAANGGIAFSSRSGNSHSGRGTTERRGKIVASVTVMVIEVLDNGNLRIEGTKDVQVNDDTETITVSGIVRPEDIESGNIIYSTTIFNAKISVKGSGETNINNKRGLLTRFLSWLF